MRQGPEVVIYWPLPKRPINESGRNTVTDSAGVAVGSLNDSVGTRAGPW